MIVDRYYYAKLNKTDQKIYKTFYKGLLKHKKIIPVKGLTSQQQFDRIYAAITFDNPLIYFINQSACSVAVDAFGRTAICPQYFYSKEKVKLYNKKIEKVVNELITLLNLSYLSDYEKEKRIHDWMCQYVSYDYDGYDASNVRAVIESHNIIGVFAKRKAQCEGIAKAMKVLLNAVDVKCIVVEGECIDKGKTELHGWNIVNINNKPYQLDVTWDIAASKEGVAYDYFNITDDIMGIDHFPVETNLPKCDSLEANYFRVNNLLFYTKFKALLYIEREAKRGRLDFYFWMPENKSNSLFVNEAVRIILRTKGGCSIRQSINETIGTYRISVV